MPAYINGNNTLSYRTADGKLIKQRLDDEDAFRKRFREAQDRATLPEWAWIKPPEGKAASADDSPVT